MEKRKAYIIASLIILSLITVLAFWYLYTAKQELNIGQVTELDLYGVVGGGGDMYSSNNNQASTQVSNITSTQSNSGAPSDINATTSTTTNEIQGPEIWQLSQIYTDPVVGVNVTGDTIRFVDQKTGNVLESIGGDTPTHLSEDVLQGVENAYFTSTNSVLILHNNNTYPTSVSFVDSVSTTTSIDLYDDIIESTQSIHGGDVYYTSTNVAKRSTVLKSIDDQETELWSTILSGWLLQALDEYIAITQKASNNIPGYAYLIPKSGTNNDTSLLLLVRDMPGLITNVSPDAEQLLYSSTDGIGTRLYLKSTDNIDIIQLSIETLASKCAWGRDSETLYCAVPHSMPGTLPDDWYKGIVHFSDSLWRINSKTGDAIELAHNTGLDIIEIKEDAVNGIVVFKNKIDQSLWSVIQD